MEFKLLQYTAVILLAITCLSNGEDKKETQSAKTKDAPMKVKLSQELVSEISRNLQTSDAYTEGGRVNSTVNGTTLAVPQQIKESTMLPPPAQSAAVWPDAVVGYHKNSSIKARKGVDLQESLSDNNCTCCTTVTSKEELNNCTCCNVSLAEHVISNVTMSTTTLKPTKDKVISVTTADTTVASITKLNTSSSTLMAVHHHKPNVTSDAPDPAVPAQQEDYVIPVIGILFAIPLVIILAALVYKKGADLWERRHYRRMDFLIDGIYNQ